MNCACPDQAETLMSLFKSVAHWEFELLLMVLFDGLIGAVMWPFVKKHLQHHLARDKREGHQ
jgi:hypothetical protein